MIDDFGTGHSTLPNLRTLPVDTIKIDLSFMKDIASQTRDGVLVKSTIGFGKALNLEVVGKYVENKEQFIFLKQAGCSIAQGYFISKPLSSEQMLSLNSSANPTGKNRSKDNFRSTSSLE